MKKNDIILLSALLGIFLIIYLISNAFNFSEESKYEVHIRESNGNIIIKDINENGKFTITSDKDNFINKYEIKDGFVNMLESNCKDKLCVNMKEISKTGEMIVCLPHKVYISVHNKIEKAESNNKDEDKVDAVAE